MARIILLGGSSFIAKSVADSCQTRGLEFIVLPHDDALEGLRPQDSLINFSIAPAYRQGPYDPATDCDLRAARMADRSGAGFVMLSTRRVYGPNHRWQAHEDYPALGDETAYGQNKARTEKAVQEALGDRAAIFRLSNVFGYEYDRERPRRSFLGILLASLKEKNTIHFDMHTQTRRDFLPVEICADLLLDRALDHTPGTWNLGSGIGLPCGDLADGIREGFGGGELICDPDIVRDEFCLSMDKWRSQFPLPVTREKLYEYCVGLGKRLKCAQY